MHPESQQLFGVKITSKMNSAPLNYSVFWFSAKCNILKIIILEGFLTFGGLKCPQGVHNNFLGENNTKNEISTIKLLRVQIFSKIQQL